MSLLERWAWGLAPLGFGCHDVRGKLAKAWDQRAVAHHLVGALRKLRLLLGQWLKIRKLLWAEALACKVPKVFGC